MAQPAMNVAFFVDENGCWEGKPYVLPHKPGTRAYGLTTGWYIWNVDPSLLIPADEDMTQEDFVQVCCGPYESEYLAKSGMWWRGSEHGGSCRRAFNAKLLRRINIEM